MAGLVPAIHAFLGRQGVDARDKRGHDERWFWRNEPENSFWPNEPETYGRLPEPSDSNYDAYKWIAGDMNSAFRENGLVREKSYVW